MMQIFDVIALIADQGLASKQVAGELESAIITEFPEADEDERFCRLMEILASYEPLGGEFMYDARQLSDECKVVRDYLASERND